MAVNYAILVGVSNYEQEEFPNLPFCRNDILAIRNSLTDGLKFKPDNIRSLGLDNHVSEVDFITSMKEVSKSIEPDDTFVLYYSGHGATLKEVHFLAFSDKLIKTQSIIKFVENIKAKTKIIFLDTCYSGQFELLGHSRLDFKESINDFISKGIVVFTSSNANQTSNGHPDKLISVFTNILCEAMSSSVVRRNGIVTLHDIVKFVLLYIELWNKENPNSQQFPIYRGNIGGTIQFKVAACVEYKPLNYFKEYDKYIITSIEPYHHSLAKRLSVEVLLKEPVSLEDISSITNSIIEEVKYTEIHQNKMAEEFFKDKPANIIWCYFANDESDIVNKNFICHTTWVDSSQDKKYWYKENGTTSFLLHDIHFDIHSYYDTLKNFNTANTCIQPSVIEQNRCILRHMITSAEKLIKIYNEFLNGTINEEELYLKFEGVIEIIDENYFESSDINLPTKEVKDYDQECHSLYACIHNLTIYFNRRYTVERSMKNRNACMQMAIENYYNQLERVSKAEKDLNMYKETDK